MIPSTSSFITYQSSLARKPLAKCLISDYAELYGIDVDDSTNVIAGSAEAGLATMFTPDHDMSIESVSLFMKSDSSPNQDVIVEIQTVSAGKPSGTVITNGTGKIIKENNTAFRWWKARFENTPSLTSGTGYFLVARTTGSTFSYYWGEDESYTGGEWTRNVSGGAWATTTSGATLICKLRETKYIDTGIITTIATSGISAWVECSAKTWSADQWSGYMANITAVGVSGDSDNLGMSFYVTSSTVSSLRVDIDPAVRGIVAGDTLSIENLNNFQLMDHLIDFSIDDQRDRTINTASVNLQNNQNQFYESKPKNSLIEVGNEVILKIGFVTEYLQQFRGFILNNTVTDGIANIYLQDVMGQFQRKPHNTGNIDGKAYEEVIYGICYRYGLPFISDLTGLTISAGTSLNDSSDALSIMNKIRESVAWRLYGDNYGRVRFRRKTIAGASVFELGQDDFILRNGLSTQKTAKETINQIGATNKDDLSTLTFADERLLANYVGTVSATALSIPFVSAGCYGNLRWEDNTNDGSVYVEEVGASRNTGKVTSATGNMVFNVSQIGVSANYNIKIYGSEIALSGNEFYVERATGSNQNEIGLNTTKLIVYNKLFKTTGQGESFCDEIQYSRGETKRTIQVNCRGIANIETEDTVNIDHPSVNVGNLYLARGISKQFRSGSFTTSFELEDTNVTTDDIRYDIGLRYDTGVRYDGG